MDTLESVPEQSCQQSTTIDINVTKRKEVIKDAFGNIASNSLKKSKLKCESPAQQNATTAKLIKLENNIATQFLNNNETNLKNFFNCGAENLKMEDIEASSKTNNHLENENSSPWLFAPLQLQHHLQQQNQHLPITTSALEFLEKIE